MKASNFTTSILVDQSAKEVFTAITNVRGWWSEEIEGNTTQLNAEWNYHYQDVHRCKLKITELVPNKKIVWYVLDNFFSFTKDKSEWKDTQIIFEISTENNKTKLQFTHAGLVPEYECFDICQNAWNTYVQKSLYDLITTGTGHPNGKDKPQTEAEKKLSHTNFTTTFFVNQSPSEVFKAVNNVRGWWQGDIEGNTTQLNDEFSYRVPGIHFSKQKLVEFTADKKVVWSITESELTFTQDKTEWTGTKIIFDITEINNKTQLRFTHEGLVPTFECYGDCSNAWEKLIQESLFSLITTGKGTNVFG